MLRQKRVGIIGAGKFGLALANLAGVNLPVTLYSRRTDLVQQVNQKHSYRDIKLSRNITATNDPNELCETSQLIFQVTPSIHFRKVIQLMGDQLTPRHIIIHGTKGFDLWTGRKSDEPFNYDSLELSGIHTMSDVILQETDVIRVGALCGPNLADEILQGLPTATVIASEFDEVIKMGKEAIGGDRFFVFGSHDIKAAELAGALKNVIALASGILRGKSMGKNAESMLIVRGLREMMLIGEALGSDSLSFYGTSGLGDLIATATSTKSRNFRCGMRIAQGERIEDIVRDSQEVIEGIRTIKIAYRIVNKLRLRVPIISTIYKILFENKRIEESIYELMKYPLTSDIDLK